MEENTIMDVIRDLIESKQYTKLRQAFADMNTADIAAIMDDMENEDSLKMFRILPKDMAADVFANLEIEDQQYIIQSLSDKEAGNIIDNLMADDATDLLEEMPASIVKKILANARPDTRADINHLLRYPEDSAGSIMTVEYVDLKEYMTVSQAIARIRKIGLDSETVNICYVVTNQRILVGTVALRYLLIKDGEEKIGDIMNTKVISINTMTDQEEAANMFKKYDFTAMPVVDNENRMIGIITIDDVVDIIEEEATEDIEKMAAIIPSDKPYSRIGIFDIYKNRMPWLLFLMISATFTGAIITKFSDALSAYVVLTAYIPMLMDTGGNAGSQASVSIIRSLSLGEIEFADIFKVWWKEVRVAVLCGITLSVANFVKLLVIDRLAVSVAAVVCLTLVLVVIIAKSIGCLLPMCADKLGFDPAVMASPMITTIVDAISLLAYFTIATQLLHLAV
ncbi:MULTISPECIES: magnesium transporter [unclassified Butyrivibrio]|uniref:magnesium transporter n=1 Tax=unclassified Butyrivibrio TaxID=2639466 RepID=UPI000415AC6F|nr:MULTISPECIES: magnesium transporter [unclassified Butyrivibrio]